MDKSVTAALVLIFLAVMLGSLALSWWARKKRQSGYAQLETVPTELGQLLGTFDGLYLATTPTGEPLNRVAVQGLGFRSRTRLELFTAGLVFIEDRFVPAACIRTVGRASWTIDRGVEPDGLTVVSWTLGEAQLDSYFRLDSPEEFLAASRHLNTQAS
jgi:hypothetical protein